MANKLNSDVFLGSWTNSNFKSEGIRQFEIKSVNGTLHLEVLKIGKLIPSGLVQSERLRFYSNGPKAVEASGFHCNPRYTGGVAQLAGNINSGLIIIAAYLQNVTDQQEQNFFFREFYFRN